MEITSSTLKAIYNDNENQTTKDTNVSKKKYELLLKELSTTDLNNQEQKSALKSAIQAYFWPSQDTSSIEVAFRRLDLWSDLFSYIKEIQHEYEAEAAYVYDAVCEVILEQHDQILAQFTNRPETFVHLANILYLNTDAQDFYTLIDSLEKNPELLRSPVLASILVNNQSDYDSSLDEGTSELLTALNKLFLAHSPDLSKNQDALMGWIWFWISQSSKENQSVLNGLVEQYFSNSYVALVQAIIRYANNKKINFTDLLGKINLLEYLPENQKLLVNEAIKVYLENPTHAKVLMDFADEKYREMSYLTQQITGLLLYLPPRVLADEELFKKICDIITKNIIDEHPISTEITLLNKIVGAMSEFEPLAKSISNQAQISSLFRIMTHLLRELDSVSPEIKISIIQIIYKYFSTKNHTEVLFNYCVNNILQTGVENRLILMRFLPSENKTNPITIDLISQALQKPEISEGCDEAIKEILYTNIRHLSTAKLALLLMANQGNPIFTYKILYVFDAAASSAAPETEEIKGKFITTLQQSEIAAVLNAIELSVGSQIQSMNLKYSPIRLGLLLRYSKDFFSETIRAFLMANTRDEKQRITEDFIAEINVLLAKRTDRTMNSSAFPNLLQDLLDFKHLVKIDVQIKNLKAAALAHNKISMSDFTKQFIDETIKAANDEILEEEDEDPQAGVPYNILSDLEKSQMRMLLETLIKSHLIKRGGIDNQQYVSKILMNLQYTPDLAKYLRPILNAPGSTANRINDRATRAKISLLLSSDFPIDQAIPELESGGQKKLRF